MPPEPAGGRPHLVLPSLMWRTACAHKPPVQSSRQCTWLAKCIWAARERAVNRCLTACARPVSAVPDARLSPAEAPWIIPQFDMLTRDFARSIRSLAACQARSRKGLGVERLEQRLGARQLTQLSDFVQRSSAVGS